MKSFRSILCIAVVAVGFSYPAALGQTPLGTAFTYQGRLLDGGLPAEGKYDFKITLYDDLAAGSAVGGPIALADWPVTGGLFTASLDFGSGVFTGDARWLGINVRPWDSAGAYTPLSPRQELTPAPYSLRASNGVGGPQALNVDAADKVGIGMSTPNHKLEVTHATSGESAMFAEHTRLIDDTPAILGEHIDSANGFGIGVQGRGGYKGVDGIADRSAGMGFGVRGWATGTSTSASYGVYGLANAAGTNYGVYGQGGSGTTNWGGYFVGNGHFSGDVGIGTTSVGDHKLEVTHATEGESAIFAEHTLVGSYTPAILGEHAGTDGWGIGVQGRGGYLGVDGIANRSVGLGIGVSGEAGGTSSSPSFGVHGNAGGLGVNYGVHGTASGGTTNYAGYFDGDVHVTGTLSKSAGSFKIDHPLDPENKYLYHSFVESPDMMNVYNGNVVLDENGEATVEMAEWFDTLNRDFRYQLTAIGAPGPNLYVSREMSNNTFKIAGGKAGMKVSWQVTGIRQDPFANAHRIPVEETKSDEHRGRYLHPEDYGQPKERGIDYLTRVALEERHPAVMHQPREAASDSLEDAEDADLSRGLHAPKTREDTQDDEGNAIEPAGLSNRGGAR